MGGNGIGVAYPRPGRDVMDIKTLETTRARALYMVENPMGEILTEAEIELAEMILLLTNELLSDEHAKRQAFPESFKEP